jgi:exopolysaccharide biosynthesis polyprenyl glycosylphosphotransferase
LFRATRNVSREFEAAKEDNIRLPEEAAGLPRRRFRLSRDLDLVPSVRSGHAESLAPEKVGGSPADRGGRLRRFLVAGDLVALLMASLITLALPVGNDSALEQGGQIAVVILSLPIFLAIAHLMGLYHLVDRHLDHSVAEELGPAFMTVSVWVFLVLMSSNLFAAEPLIARWFAGLWGLSLAGILLSRALVRRLAQRSRWYRQRALVVGDPGGIDRVLLRIRRHPECGLDVVGAIYRTGPGLRAYGYDEAGVRHDLGHRPTDTPGDVADLLENSKADRVIVTGWAEALEERTDLIRMLTGAGVYVDIVSGEPEALLVGATMHHLEGLPLMTVCPNRITRIGRALKRLIDVCVAGLGLLVLSPAFAYVSVRIKLDSKGPVLFTQPRVGRKGKRFEIYKFRTMVDGAESMKDELRDESIGGHIFKLVKDPRVTKFGARLRRSSLDELPQLWNVFKGDMSLVGPRPLPLDEAPLAEDYFSRRDRMRPGITGPWQIHGRSDIPFDDMVKLDYTYVSTWSLQEDLRLLIRTVSVVFAGRGAY